ncbi:DNA methyltransferase [Clostridium sp. AM33-3]|uniref:DNA methyltransferase n=1 Tax=Clostridium sp. AM33-3 TaxID=2292304 RepID=UPI000E4C2B08|nr:DNA methyltransferase [Clostridium sp. AM33-3]RHT22913.1 DUF1156 domain-containing protein [Clostridium sp. AM33-3]
MPKKDQRLIEADFPFDELSIIAEQESWRKEVNRPASYIHKWWARRLGSVFRGLIIGGVENPTSNFFERFYGNTSYKGKVVFDPFMGSGTTIHEAIKLGATAIGSDINPVAATLVRAASDTYNRADVEETFRQLESCCSDKIKRFYKATYEGKTVDVLYYFWVKTVTCDDCGNEIPLIKSSIFSKNAYAAKKPEAQSVCPHCGHINKVLYNDTDAVCEKCREHYDPQRGNIRGIDYVCPVCGKRERIVDYMRRKGVLPKEKMYAKMVLDHSGRKHYLSIDEYDLRLYEEASDALSEFERLIPTEYIYAGINTNQILNYQYRQWKDMFNSRQLLAFGMLSDAISKIEDPKLRRLFAVLMSGTLEFNNMFCSFKGEGTGAVRPLFYNHILKNELMPLEANPWGCKASSGSFSTLFETRILRMIDYKENPFELRATGVKKSEKVYLNGCRDQALVVTDEHELSEGKAAILCKDSAHTAIPDKSVDLVVTDPPFFDNVNYSELADFFYVWLKRLVPEIDPQNMDTTRVKGEVQDNDPDKFSDKLTSVFKESHRVLKSDGLLIFTYHHSRTEGWVAVCNAIKDAGFTITQVVPIKAEMAVSVAIMAAKEPINYDLVFVCRKSATYEQLKLPVGSQEYYQEGLSRIRSSNLHFSRGDMMIFKYGIALKQLSEAGAQEITKEIIEQIVNTLEE